MKNFLHSCCLSAWCFPWQPAAESRRMMTLPKVPRPAGTIQVGLNSAPVSMNIWCQNDLNSATIMNLVCPNLVAIDDDGNKYDYLTESSEANEDWAPSGPSS